jgi:DNA-binding PadR family transcriptional regulator
MPEPPLRRHEYFILLALADADRHGLAIAREVEALSDGALRLWPVTLYGSLERLRRRGLIEELDEPGERPADESQRKRFYRITACGRRGAAAETKALAALVARARRGFASRARTRAAGRT